MSEQDHTEAGPEGDNELERYERLNTPVEGLLIDQRSMIIPILLIMFIVGLAVGAALTLLGVWIAG